VRSFTAENNVVDIAYMATFTTVPAVLGLLSFFQPHILSCNNFSRFQSAYRPGYSTETALLKVVSDIQLAAGEGKCTVLLGLDISAAFDAVDHAILCKRAESDFGICGTALKWLHSFVTDRLQYIAIGSERSETTALSTGVPQGSILGPLLFAFYVSPIGRVVHSHGLLYHQYADDVMLYTALLPSLNNDLAFIERCTSAVSSWFLENALLLNPDETEAVIFGARQRLAGFDSSSGIDVASSNVSFNDSLKLLGVTLDATLSFDKRVERCSQLHVSYKSSASHPAIAYC